MIAPSDTEMLTAAAQARVAAVRALAAAPGLDVAVVVAHLDAAAFIRGAADFALAVPEALRDGWYRMFTRTVFLAGQPTALAGRYPYQHATPNGQLAWYGPAPRRALTPLSRLLRAFSGPAPMEAPAGALAVTVPGPPSGHHVGIALAVGGVSTGEYLVHVHHLIAEASLRGLIRPGDTLLVDHRPALAAADFRDALDPARAGSVQTRIAPARTGARHLRLFGVLTSNRHGGDH
ncbi:DUF6182 family protein [Streptomyces sp. AC555_RSS877]|uniref:DUF6182 family protein n=1 Tax=Streptomyces sp. AC555_RSS877 TaxID=2823688 RepID=UPI001C274893|nr:DUF6182 family protein [Streptomyces sp. AC555_RSS877]